MSIGIFLVTAGSAHAAPDFYGVKMKSEDFARNIQLRENNLTPNYANHPGADKRVYAYGFVSSNIGGSKGVAIQVYNHSDKPLLTEKMFRDVTIVLRDGTRYDRCQTEMMFSRRTLDPGENATFNFKFPGISVPKEDVRFLICSFDLGATQIYLFPMPSAQAERVLEKKPRGFMETVQSWIHPKPKKAAEPVKKDDPVKEQKDTEVPKYPLIKAEQVIDGVKYNFRPDFREEVGKAQKELDARVYRDRPWTLEGPDKYLVHQEAYEFPKGGIPRRLAQVAIVKEEYGFVVVNAGYNDGFDKNAILDVLRNGRKIGKVMITKPRDHVSAAMILHEWRTKDAIRVGDLVGISE